MGAKPPTARPPPAARVPNRSRDGVWQRFPEMPHLLQHVPTGVYYATIKIGSRAIRRELHGWTPAMVKASLAIFLRRLFLQDGERDPRAVELFQTLIRQNVPEYQFGPGSERADALASSGLIEPEVVLTYVPTPENFERLVNALAAGKKGAGTALLVRFLAYSGCRVAEAGQITWADVDWEHGELVVNRGLSVVRRVAMNPSLRELLEGRKKQDPDALPTESVLQVTACRAVLKKTCEELGIPPVTPLDLRYLFIARAREAGVDAVTIARWLGHKRIDTLTSKVIRYSSEEPPAAPEP